VRRACFERPPGTSCTNFRPISSCNAEHAKNSNGVRWENSLHRVNPFCWPPPRFRSYSENSGQSWNPRDLTSWKRKPRLKNVSKMLSSEIIFSFGKRSFSEILCFRTFINERLYFEMAKVYNRDSENTSRNSFSIHPELMNFHIPFRSTASESRKLDLCKGGMVSGCEHHNQNSSRC